MIKPLAERLRFYADLRPENPRVQKLCRDAAKEIEQLQEYAAKLNYLLREQRERTSATQESEGVR